MVRTKNLKGAFRDSPLRRLAVVTGGGDCPGLNAAIRAVCRRAFRDGIEVIGIQDGFAGLHDGRTRKLSRLDVSGILTRGGTILRSSRFNPFRSPAVLKRCLAQWRKLRCEGLIVIGGNGSLGIAGDFWMKEGLPVLGIPKTIDNDVPGTDACIGFATAVQTAVDAIDRLHTTAESHNFVMVIELMGRHCGQLAAYAGLAGGADYILVPEKTVCADDLIASLKRRHSQGKNFSIVAVSEDARLTDSRGRVLVRTPTARDEYGHIKISGVGFKVAGLIQQRTGFETRCTVLGHLQRGGSPIAQDRILATRLGAAAVELAQQGIWGQMMAWRQGQVKPVELSVIKTEKAARLSTADHALAELFFD